MDKRVKANEKSTNCYESIKFNAGDCFLLCEKVSLRNSYFPTAVNVLGGTLQVLTPPRPPPHTTWYLD